MPIIPSKYNRNFIKPRRFFSDAVKSYAVFRYRYINSKMEKLPRDNNKEISRIIVYSGDIYHRAVSMAIYSGAIMVLASLILWYLEKGINTYAKGHYDMKMQMVESFRKEERSDAYKILIKSGRANFVKKDYAEAYREYARASRLYKYGRTSNVGMTESLIALSENDLTYCEGAVLYLKFVSKMNYISFSKFEQLNNSRIENCELFVVIR